MLIQERFDFIKILQIHLLQILIKKNIIVQENKCHVTERDSTLQILIKKNIIVQENKCHVTERDSTLQKYSKFIYSKTLNKFW